MNKHVVNLVKSVEHLFFRVLGTYTMIGTSRYLVTYGAIKAVKMGMERADFCMNRGDLPHIHSQSKS